MENNQDFLGKGWGFPPEFDKKKRKVKMVSGREDIEQSLGILLETVKGERVMFPHYGSNLDEMVFESLDQSIKTYLAHSIETTILYHEPRIEPLRIEINENKIHEGKLLIEIEYRIKATNSRFNMVYPFYLEEGTEI